MIALIVVPREANQRLDVFLRSKIRYSRSAISGWVKKGLIQVNDCSTESSYIVQAGDKVSVTIPESLPTALTPQKIPLEILYEDDDLIVVNKPKGMVVYPSPGHSDGTLLNVLLAHAPVLGTLPGGTRPGIVHRLDKDTSGVIVVAKNDETREALIQQFKERKVFKKYVALVHGVPQEKEGIIEVALMRSPRNRKRMMVVMHAISHQPSISEAGARISHPIREATTAYRVLKTWKEYALLEIFPKTGRTHQIRVHLAHKGYPVVGDLTYGKRSNPFAIQGQLLHAQTLGFVHPRSGEYKEYSAPIPTEIARAIEGLNRL